MTKILRCGVVGLGLISKFYLKAIENNKSIELIAVCDNNKKKLNQYKKKNVNKFEDFEGMLSSSNLDLVILTIPNHLHFEFIIKCIKSKVNVLCEKPLVTCFSEAKKISALAKKNKVYVRTAYHRQFNKHFIELQKNIQTLGKIKYIRGTYLEKISEHSESNWYKQVSISDGGCVIDNGTNMINIFQTLLGKLSVSKKHLEYYPNSKIEKSATVYMKTLSKKKSINVILELDWEYPGEKKEIIVVGENDTLIVDFLKDYTEFKSSLWHEYEGVMSNFLKCYDSKDYVLGNDLEVIKLVEIIYKNI